MIAFIGHMRSDPRALYFRKKFVVRKAVRRATLDYTALGIVKAYCNSEAFGEEMLTPGWTDYNVRIPYYSVDFTDNLKVGANTLTFALGNGWAVGKIAWFGDKSYMSKPLLWCRVCIEYEDGEEEIFGSDDSFRMAFGQTLENDLFDGEVQDGRFDLGDFGHSDYDDSEWMNAVMYHGYTDRLERAIVPLTLKKERFVGKYLYEKDGFLIYDFGQNHAGVPEIKISDASEGSELTFIYGEMLDDDGSVYVKNFRTAKVTDKYICRGGEQRFCPEMTFHGYRYMGVKIDGECRLQSIESRMIYSDIDFRASFECSDKNINKLYSNIIASQKSNFINVPTDCPQRDERLGWTGDAQVFGLSAMYNADCRAFFKKYLQDVRDAQADNGMIDSVAPIVWSDFDKVKGSPAWGDVITVIPYEYYHVYGDDSIIRENISAAKRWVDYCLCDSVDNIRNPRGYGDWLSYDGGTDKSLIGTAFCGYSALLVSKMCDIIGDGDSGKYLEIFENVRNAFRKRYITEGGKLSSDSQTAYVLSYSLQMMDADEIKEHLVRCIEAQGYHIATGFVGVKYLLPTLCDIGEYDLAYKLFTSTEHPSWCYPVVNGATTMWERWDSYVVGRGFREQGCNSFNHYAFGSVAEWMFAYVLGIRFENGCISIKPIIDESGSLSFASGSYRLDKAYVEVSWKNLEGGRTALEIHNSSDVTVDLSDYSEVERVSESLYLIKR
ncbi:MAG: family 78 glycoside hydrolase catalytic domain [Clostridia bacterium]|nr:family 78 glycoside hydrolase catalytic domain [Clostridia bacterium]